MGSAALIPPPPLLTATGLSKRFGGLAALEDVSFTLAEGSITGLIGPNGAGKTTLFNCLTGLYRPDSGRVLLGDQDITGRRPHTVLRHGLARTFQNIRLFANMTALENVMVGMHTRLHAGPLGAVLRSTRVRAEEALCVARAQSLLERFGLAAQANQTAHTLPYGSQRRLEIARALASEPRLLALDEPAAGMSAAERDHLASLLHGLRDEGLSLLLIEHDVPLVMALCDQVVALDYGRKIADGPPQTVRHDPAVVAAWLGADAVP
jgi:branched-chain amino acid transport system ATP-binding protein